MHLEATQAWYTAPPLARIKPDYYRKIYRNARFPDRDAWNTQSDWLCILLPTSRDT